MAPLKIVLCARQGEQYFHLLDDLEGLEITRCEPEQLFDHASDMEVFFGAPSGELIQAAPKLKWIQSPSAGVESVVNIPNLVNSDIQLTNTRGAHAASIGEHTIALLLALTRHVLESIHQQTQRIWDRTAFNRTARDIGGMTMGVIGFGALGRGIALRAKGMGMNVLAVDAQAVDGTGLVDEVWPVSQLDDLLEQSDVVVVAAPYTAETQGLIGPVELARMKLDAYLIAVSRGGIVDEGALVDALKNDQLAGAALDVTRPEPPEPDSPLWDCPRLLLTPHMAGASAGTKRGVVEIFRDNIVRYQNGEPLLNLVDKTRGF